MKIMLFANTDWYLYNFRGSLAHALRDAGHDVLLVSPAGPYGPKLQAQGFRWVSAPMDRCSLNPLRELVLINWLRQLMNREAVDVVHGFTIKCAVYGSLAGRLARGSGGVPARVSAVAGLGYVFTNNAPKARVLRPVVRGLFRLALGGSRSRLVLQNPDDVTLFEQAGLIAPERVRLIPGSGVDCVRFHPAEPTEADARPRSLRVLLPARLLWDKGLAEYVAAARALRASGRSIHFLLAGTPDAGNPATVPEATVREWEAEGVLKWLGHVNDMPALYRAVDVVVLPSYREGLPKGLIEAAACGLPLVTTDVPGCREVVSDGVNGYLVPAKNANALAQAMARMHDDPAERQRMGAAARARVLAAFDERIVIRDTLAVYAELLDMDGGTPTGPQALMPLSNAKTHTTPQGQPA
ncbi:glycosyltransferase family 4 protein [Hydrogenophaga sp.]|uniref:glycosyltransferase family 4 protein n=1 Tax=Hydrogenophaga sp. TaxID=1904254 RepID=UPI00286E188A|nr:glycosyltransferase family 4 protein [Hydrogenophaga sp.]